MRPIKLRIWMLVAAVPALAVGVVLPAANAVPAATNSGGVTHKVIVVLRDQNTGLAPRSAARLAAVRSEQAPVIADLHSAGASVISTTSFLNTVTASVSSSEESALASNTAVAQVVPDAVIPGPNPVATPSAILPNVSSNQSLSSAQACGTAASPELDPEFDELLCFGVSAGPEQPHREALT